MEFSDSLRSCLAKPFLVALSPLHPGSRTPSPLTLSTDSTPNSSPRRPSDSQSTASMFMFNIDGSASSSSSAEEATAEEPEKSLGNPEADLKDELTPEDEEVGSLTQGSGASSSSSLQLDPRNIPQGTPPGLLSQGLSDVVWSFTENFYSKFEAQASNLLAEKAAAEAKHKECQMMRIAAENDVSTTKATIERLKRELEEATSSLVVQTSNLEEIRHAEVESAREVQAKSDKYSGLQNLWKEAHADLSNRLNACFKSRLKQTFNL